MVKRDNHTDEDARAPRVVKASELHKRKAPSQKRATKDDAAASSTDAQVTAHEQVSPEGNEESTHAAKRKRVERTRFVDDAMLGNVDPAADAVQPADAPADAAQPADAHDGQTAEDAGAQDSAVADDGAQRKSPVLKVIRGAKSLLPSKEGEEQSAAAVDDADQAHAPAEEKLASQQGAQDAAQDASAGEATAEAESPDESAGHPSVRTRRGEPAKPKRIWTKVVAGVLAVLVLASAIVVGVFVWNRSYRYDDFADLQGVWYAEGTATPITIDEQYIYISPDVKYSYELNTADKTLTFSFGKMDGQGRYWFTADRTHVVIVDGEGYTGASTLFEDAERAFDELISGSPRPLPTGDNVIVLSRTAAASTSMTTGVDDTQPSESAESADDEEDEDSDDEDADVTETSTAQ